MPEYKEVKHIAEIGWRAFVLALITLGTVALYYFYLTKQIIGNPDL